MIAHGRSVFQALFLVLAVLLVSPAHAARQDVIGVLDRLVREAADLKLTASIDVPSGSRDTHNLGDDLRFNLQANRDAYVYIVRVDNNGVGWLTVPQLDQTNLLKANVQGVYPTYGDTVRFTARAPLGTVTSYVIATSRPVDVAALGLSGNAASELEIGASKAKFEELRGKLVSAGAPQLAAVKLEHRVKARQGETQFTSSDLVAYFTTTTRAIKRPKMDADIRFEPASANLTPEAKKNLSQWGQAMTDPRLADKKFKLGGHTDDVGADDYNMKLSLQRSAAVKEYLEKQHGIPSNRLVVEAHGKRAPAISASTEEARAANRRVEFEMQRPE